MGKSGQEGRLGTHMRGELTEAYAARGRLASKLVYHYSPRMRCDVVLKSELEFWHFILAESDSQIASIEYNPQKVMADLDGSTEGTILDAVVTLKNGSIQWREIKYSNDVQIRTKHQKEAQAQAAYDKGAIYLRFTENEIFHNRLKIQNWLEVVAWMAAVRSRPTLEYDLAISSLLSSDKSVTIGEIQSLAESRQISACYIAAAFRKIQEGKFFSDLDLRPLTPNTVISLSEVT